MITKIYVAGLLGKKFGSFFKINISSVYSALKAIDCNKSGFLKEIFSLNSKNYNYFIICNGIRVKNKEEFIERKKIETIHIIPAITGSGALVAAGLGLAAGTLAYVAVEFLVNFVVSTVVSLGVSFLMQKLNKEAAPPTQQKIAVGGISAAIEAQGRSYVFSNNINTASQGSAVPVGYGIMKKSSQVIMASFKNYPTSSDFKNESKNNENSSIFLDFLTD